MTTRASSSPEPNAVTFGVITENELGDPGPCDAITEMFENAIGSVQLLTVTVTLILAVPLTADDNTIGDGCTQMTAKNIRERC